MHTLPRVVCALSFAATLLFTACQGTAGTTDFARPGFVTQEVEGRLWVFRDGSPELAEFRQAGEPSKAVTRIGKGPGGMTIKAPDSDTIDAYMAAFGR